MRYIISKEGGRMKKNTITLLVCLSVIMFAVCEL